MKHFILIFLFVLLTFKVFGNGAPIDGCAVFKTGDVVLINVPEIELLKEDLNLKIEGDYSIVHVTYK